MDPIKIEITTIPGILVASDMEESEPNSDESGAASGKANSAYLSTDPNFAAGYRSIFGSKPSMN